MFFNENFLYYQEDNSYSSFFVEYLQIKIITLFTISNVKNHFKYLANFFYHSFNFKISLKDAIE